MRCLVLLVLVGCGRIGFDATVATDAIADGTNDSATDGPTLSFAHVQSHFTCLDQQTTLDVPLATPQTQGNINIVAIGINDLDSTITGVTDTAGNTYTLAVGPTTSSDLRQYIYYAVPIAAAANTVTVTFDQSAALVGVTVAEYSGVSQVDPILTTAGDGGDSMNSDSGPAIVSGPALLVGANSNALPGTDGPGPEYTQRVFTDYDDILEDRVVTTAGTYRADAPLTGGHVWVMQMLALRPQ